MNSSSKINDAFAVVEEQPVRLSSPTVSPERKRQNVLIGAVIVVAAIALVILIPVVLIVPNRGGANEATAGAEAGGGSVPGDISSSIPTPSPSNLPTSSPPTIYFPTADVDIAPSSQPSAYFYTSNVSAVLALVDEFASEEFYMVNLGQHREKAVYEDGRPTNLTGAEADKIYRDYMLTEVLPSIGAEIVYAAAVERDVVNNDTTWDSCAIVRYPNGTAFREMIFSPKFQEMVKHKSAGLYDTVVLGTRLGFQPNVPFKENPPFPASATDLPFAFMHIFDYNEKAVYADGDENADNNRTGEEAVGLYRANAGPVAFPLGIRMMAEFEVAVVIAGPTTGWEKVRVNYFPSHATFENLTSNPIWESGAHHRKAGIEKTYALMTSPIVINKLVS